MYLIRPSLLPHFSRLCLLFSLLTGWFVGELGTQGIIPLHSLNGSLGLSESTNPFMHRAADGLLYIGSMEGTNVFDGHRVQVFQEGNTPPGPHHYLGKFNQSKFYETSNGNIWFTTDKAIVCRSGQDGYIRSYQIDVQSGSYYAFALELDRYLWTIHNARIYRVDLLQPASIHLSVPVGEINFPRGIARKNAKGEVTEIWGSFWHEPGLVRLLVDQTGTTLGIDTLYNFPNGEKIPGLQEWIADEQGTLFAAAEGALYVFPSSSLEDTYSLPFPAPVTRTMGLAWRRPGVLWLLGVGGLLEYHNGHLKILDTQASGIPKGLATGNALYIDRDLAGQREMAWMSKYNLSITYGNLLANRIENFVIDLNRQDKRMYTIQSLPDGAFIVKLKRDWLRFDRKGQQTILEPSQAPRIEPILINDCQFMISKRDVHRVYGYSTSQKDWAPIELSFIPHAICKAGNLLAVADQFGSINFYPAEISVDSTTHTLPPPVYNISHLGPITDLEYDETRQLVWVTSSAGLFAIDPQNKSSRIYDQQNGLPVDNLRSIVIDNNDRLWLGSTRGIFDFTPENSGMTKYHLTVEDGLSSNEFFREIATVTTDGRLAFGSANGVDIFHPDSLRTTHLPTRAMFRQLKIHGKEWVGDKVLHLTESIELPYDQNALTITFAAPEFAAPKRTEFQLLTQIDGQGYDTTLLSANNEITLPNLAPATYRFGIMGRAKGNPDFDSPKWLSVTIHPHWTGTGWFRALVIVASLLLASLIVAAWFRYQLRVQEALAAEERVLAAQREARLQRKIDLEDQRRRITSRMHNDIGGSLTTLSMLSSRLNRTKDLERAGEISSKISHWAKDVRRRVSSFLRVMNPNFDQLSKLVGVLRTYAADVLSDNELQAEFDFPDNYPDYELTPDFSIALLEITQEVINNVLKYADATKVSMQLKVEGEEIYLSIRDNGNGFSPTEEDFKKGIGLSSLKSLAEKFGGSISYGTGTDGVGTEVNCHLIVERWREEGNSRKY